MFNWIKKLFVQIYEPLKPKSLELGRSLREKGQDYAYEYLQNGGTYEKLEALADCRYDFNDFDRGILDVVRNRGIVKGE